MGRRLGDFFGEKICFFLIASNDSSVCTRKISNNRKKNNSPKNKFYGGKKRKVKDFSLKNCFSECAKLGCSVMSRRVC